MNYVLGVDVGSASVRAGVYQADGKRLAFASRPIEQFRPQADHVEQSSADIWQQCRAVMAQAIAESGIRASQISGIGFDATCSLVAVGQDGVPVSVAADGDAQRDIIMWMDHRAGEQARELNATGDAALAFVGGEISIEMELPKVLWLKRHCAERYARVWRFFDLADYLVWRASGSDSASVCTLTCKWNYLAHENRFSEEMLAAVGLADVLERIPQQILPLGSAAGRIRPELARELGLNDDVVIATGIIDAHAGGLALCGTEPQGTLALIGGTSNCHMVASADPVMVPGVWGPYLGAMLPSYWLNEGGQSAAGALLDWTLAQSAAWNTLRQQASEQGCHPHALLNRHVAALQQQESEPARNLHVLPDHHGNRSPRADAHARGLVSGLTLESGLPALARLYLATLQALAYGTRHIIDSLNQHGHAIERIVMCGGGTKNLLLLQEHADACGCDIHLVADEDAVTLGAAILAACASGVHTSIGAAASAMVRPGDVVRANPQRRAFHDAKYGIFLDLYQQQLGHRERMAGF